MIFLMSIVSVNQLNDFRGTHISFTWWNHNFNLMLLLLPLLLCLSCSTQSSVELSFSVDKQTMTPMS